MHLLLGYQKARKGKRDITETCKSFKSKYYAGLDKSQNLRSMTRNLETDKDTLKKELEAQQAAVAAKDRNVEELIS